MVTSLVFNFCCPITQVSLPTVQTPYSLAKKTGEVKPSKMLKVTVMANGYTSWKAQPTIPAKAREEPALPLKGYNKHSNRHVTCKHRDGIEEVK